MEITRKQISSIIREGLINTISRGINNMFSNAYPEGSPETIDDVIKGNGWVVKRILKKDGDSTTYALVPDPNMNSLRADYLPSNELVDDMNEFYSWKNMPYHAVLDDFKNFGYNGGGACVKIVKTQLGESISYISDGRLRNLIKEAYSTKTYKTFEQTVRLETLDVFPELDSVDGGEDVEYEFDAMVTYSCIESQGDYDTPGTSEKEFVSARMIDGNVQAQISGLLGMGFKEINNRIAEYMKDNWDVIGDELKSDGYNIIEKDPDEEMEELLMR